VADDTRRDRQGRTSTKFAAKKAATERIAAARAAQAKANRRRNLMVAGGSTLAVVLVVGVIVAVGLSTKKKTPSGGGNPVVAASSTVTSGLAAASKLTSVRPDLSTVTGPPAHLTGATLTGSGGKPQVLYVGADYCPYCAVTRWPLTVALSRFGTFRNLTTTKSAANDQAGPNTPTLSYHGASYTSQYIDFVGLEQQDGLAKPLDSLSAAQNSLFENFGKGQYPFVDFGGKWMQSGASSLPATLAGLSPEDVANDIANTTSKPGAMVAAGADVFTAIICQLDGGKPANVCTAAGVATAATALTAIK
jgi:hypothetical protein